MPARASSQPGRLVGAHTPIAFVQAITQAYALRGLSAEGALTKAQIETSSLDDPQHRVTATQFERLCAAAMQELDDEAPGWFSRRLPWGSYGLLARASITAPTLGVALRRWCRHHGLLTDDVALTVKTSQGHARVEIDERRDLGALREFALLSLLRNLHGLACWWVDAPISLQLAQFPFDAPPHADVYPRLFPGPVRFGATQAALQFDANDLALPLRRDAAALDQMLRRALPIMVWPYRRDAGLSRRVHQLLQQPHAAHTAETLAARLALSPRTLHRQLRGEGTSLQALKDEARRARATELLLRTTQPVARVARAAGFQNDKSFIRAFRQWTGLTPEQYRLTHGGGTP
ncbi:MAG: AraC family transcriptional regulator [Pseudomonadota bacterium]|nr:AraC family transcriptional regulator [Pseudomonadota bacterium]